MKQYKKILIYMSFFLIIFSGYTINTNATSSSAKVVTYNVGDVYDEHCNADLYDEDWEFDYCKIFQFDQTAEDKINEIKIFCQPTAVEYAASNKFKCDFYKKVEVVDSNKCTELKPGAYDLAAQKYNNVFGSGKASSVLSEKLDFTGKTPEEVEQLAVRYRTAYTTMEQSCQQMVYDSNLGIDYANLEQTNALCKNDQESLQKIKTLHSSCVAALASSKTDFDNAQSAALNAFNSDGSISADEQKIIDTLASSANNIQVSTDNYNNITADFDQFYSQFSETLRNNCSSIIGDLLELIQKYFDWIKIIAVVLLMIFGIFQFASAVLSNDQDALKKATSKFVKSCIATLIIFFLPFLINILFKMVEMPVTDAICGIK